MQEQEGVCKVAEMPKYTSSVTLKPSIRIATNTARLLIKEHDKLPLQPSIAETSDMPKVMSHLPTVCCCHIACTKSKLLTFHPQGGDV